MSARSDLAGRIVQLLAEPVFFWQVLDALQDQPYRAILRAWSDVRERHPLDRDEHGRYRLPG